MMREDAYSIFKVMSMDRAVASHSFMLLSKRHSCPMDIF
jgi:hypothetical protein